MPDSNNYEILLKFVMDNQGADKAIKTLTDFNKSFKDLNLGLEELDKKGLSTFDKLISTLTSSRTGNAIQQLNSLSASLKSLGFTAAQISAGSSQITQPGERPIGFSATTLQDPYIQQQIQSIFSEQSIITDRDFNVPSGLYMGGLMGAGAYGGGGGGGGRNAGPNEEEYFDYMGIKRFRPKTGLVPALAAIRGFAQTAAPFLVAGAATTAGLTALDMISTGELSQTQAAQIQAYNLRIPLAAAKGDITLSSLRTLGIGLGAQAESGGIETTLRAYGTQGLSNLFSGLGNILTLSFKEGAQQIASVVSPQLLRAQYIQAKRDADIALFGPQFDLMRERAAPVYSTFLDTYRMYGQRGANAVIEPLLSSGQFTVEDLERAQGIGLSAGVGMRGVPEYTIGTRRRFLYGQSAEKAAMVYGYGNRLGGAQSTDVINNLLSQMGVTTASAETPIFSEMIGQAMLSRSAYAFATPEGAAAPLVEASKIAFREGLTPEDQSRNILRLSKTFRGEEGQLDRQYLSISRVLIKLGISNPADISTIVGMIKQNAGDKALALINKLSPKKLSINEFNEMVSSELKPFYEFGKQLYGEEFLKAAGELGMGFIPGEGVIPLKKGLKEEEILESAAIGLTGLFEKPATGLPMPETQPTVPDVAGREAARAAGAAISADEQMTEMGAGMINEVARGLEDIAKRIRNYPKDYRSMKQTKAVEEAKKPFDASKGDYFRK